MTDKLSKKRRSWNMQQIRSTDTSPELVVRKLTHHLGYRYRLHRKDLPGKPDLVFPARGKIVFVHGCFWHQHSSSRCKISRLPKSKTDYWTPKLQRNAERDRKNQRRLRRLGWRVLVLWECQIKDLERLARRIDRFLAV